MLDKGALWEQPPCIVKGDEEVEVEWQDVKSMYQEIRVRIKRHFDSFGYAVFVADGERPTLGDQKAGVNNSPPSYESIFNEDGQERERERLL